LDNSTYKLFLNILGSQTKLRLYKNIARNLSSREVKSADSVTNIIKQNLISSSNLTNMPEHT